jgi:hypothetical protein
MRPAADKEKELGRGPAPAVRAHEGTDDTGGIRRPLFKSTTAPNAFPSGRDRISAGVPPGRGVA